VPSATKPLTENQLHVLAALRAANAPLTAYALLERLRVWGFNAPTQVYRSLNRLVEVGVVHRLESLNAYVTCTDADHCTFGFTAFAICDSCGGVEELIDERFTASLAHLAKSHAFTPANATVELHGNCGQCADDRAPGCKSEQALPINDRNRIDE